MNTSTQMENPAESQAIPGDRGLPSVPINPPNRKIYAALFLGFATLAIVFLLVDFMHKNEPKSLIEPKEVTFRTPTTSTPYIMAEDQAKPAAPGQSVDPLTAQKDLMMQKEALRMAAEQQKKLEKRNQSAQIVYDQPENGAMQPAAGGSNAVSATTIANGISPSSGGIVLNSENTQLTGSGGTDDPNTAFANQNANKDVETASASQMQNLHTLIPQGTMIAGILETAIQSDLPGMTRAVVSENIYSFDGAKLLIPQGSRLIGQYRSGLVRGQSRVFVIWNRLIRSDGVSINIGSSGTDELGRSGLNGDVDTHFFERFGSSVLLSMIDSGLQIGAESADSRASATVAVNTGNDFSKAAEIALQNSIAIPPTVNVDQGTRINVFVGKDLDFSHVNGNQPSGLTP